MAAMSMDRAMSNRLWTNVVVLGTGLWLTAASTVQAQIVPGTGTIGRFDDFENTDWDYNFNWPKASSEDDGQTRAPLGRATNGMWNESPKRGQPDVIRRIDTPEGGLEGSLGALYLRTRDTGIPGRPGHEQLQDDLLMANRNMPIHHCPNVVARVYLPPWHEWEQRAGVSFGMRMGLQAPKTETREVESGAFIFRRRTTEEVTVNEPYYPGLFIQFNSSRSASYDHDHAQFVIRAGTDGRDVPGPTIQQPGWWTLGMSITPDGRCHYYASPGVDNLTQEDRLMSSLPYGLQPTYFNTMFFNVCSPDDGQTWSTPWIIDDAAIYYLEGGIRQARR